MKTCQKKITPLHLKTLKRDIDLKDDRAVKELIAFLVVFGKPLREKLEAEIDNQGENKILVQSWNIACEVGGAFSEKLRSFGCGGFGPNNLTWNDLASKYQENTLKSYMSLVDSLLIAYGI